MEPQIRRVGVALVVMLLLVFAQLNYVQIFAAERIAGNNANVLLLIREYSVKRGDIVTFDGEVAATSRATRGKYKYLRTYPGGDLYGHLTGYYSITYGTDRLERTYHDQLLGTGGVLSMQDIQDRFLGETDQGDDIRMTIDSQLQQAASDALGENRGAVVAMDPRTGAIKAMVSEPAFDPSPLASFNGQTARDYWNSLDPKSPESPLVNRATSQSYPPGSTLKVVTAAAALDSGQYTPDSTFPDPVRLDLPLSTETLTNFTKQSCAGGGEIDFFNAMRVSCDTTFAMLGLEIPDDIRAMAESVGFNQPLPFDLRTAASVFPDIPDDEAPLRAYAAIGQGDVRATPLQMAVVAATIANDGVAPAPHLVHEVIDPSGGLVSRTEPEMLGEPMTAETAAELTAMMEAVVQNGTGVTAQIPGVAVAGKTGTAQTGVEGENPHTWFISFAPADDPRIAVAVIVEHGGTFGSEATGGAVAGPIAKIVMEQARSLSPEW